MLNIVVKTKSGNRYVFTYREDGSLYFRDLMMSGRVIKLLKPIQEGENLSFDFLRDKDGEIRHATSTMVKEVVITQK